MKTDPVQRAPPALMARPTGSVRARSLGVRTGPPNHSGPKVAMRLKDLAEHLGLSQTTVSRALNGYPEVNEATRQRVADAAASGVSGFSCVVGHNG
jgi:transcriptional regulator with XRE-family HTH domain